MVKNKSQRRSVETSNSLMAQKLAQALEAQGTTVEELQKSLPNAPEVTLEPEPIEEVKPTGDFHNPYNFVPAPSRENVSAKALGDGNPEGHGSYLENLWSGRISVGLTVKTPLLVPDAAKAGGVKNSAPKKKKIVNGKVQTDEKKPSHFTYPLRIGIDGKPYLSQTSIKGMLRSAYEMVTNSRMGVFHKHEGRLAYRMNAETGLSLVPARIEGNCERVSLLLGTTYVRRDGKTVAIPQWNTKNERWEVPENLMYAAWLRRYEANSPDIRSDAVEFTEITHGQKVQVWLQKIERKPFFYWRVIKIVPATAHLGDQPPSLEQNEGRHRPQQDVISAEGYVCIGEKNIEKKYNERVFFLDPRHPLRNQLTVSLKPTDARSLQSAWKDLIENYQQTHDREITNGIKGPPQSDGKAVWSRHITGGDNETKLQDGTLCYAHVERVGNEFRVKALYPVMIARELFSSSPEQLLPDSLRPATQLSQLSPADRVFGWVAQKGEAIDKSYRGQLRIGAVSCLGIPDKPGEDPIANFGNPGIPLAILGQPQPQQARFYVAENENGKPFIHLSNKQDGYQEKQGLRGRKVYPHHRGIASNTDYWANPMTDRTGEPCDGYYQEYRRPKKNNVEQRDTQNRSIQAWVKPETQFQFEIDVLNLSEVELGALLWLLSLPNKHHHRLGGGKPLGFGSIELSINWEPRSNCQGTDLRVGKDWKDYYRSLLLVENQNIRAAEACIKQFKQAVIQAYGNDQSNKDINQAFVSIEFIKAFCQASRGFDQPIHYPRLKPERNVNEEGYDWFAANEKGKQRSLPALWDETGLPHNP